MSPEPVSESAFDYDSSGVSIFFAPVVVQGAATVLQTESGNVAASLGVIVDALNTLELSWVGTTAEEAAAFSARWVAVAAQLFGGAGAGDDDVVDSADGVLNVMAFGLATIADGFSAAETDLKETLDAFKASLAGGGGEPNYTTPETIGTDVHTAVNESWP